jgi:hypothetical protein
MPAVPFRERSTQARTQALVWGDRLRGSQRSACGHQGRVPIGWHSRLACGIKPDDGAQWQVRKHDRGSPAKSPQECRLAGSRNGEKESGPPSPPAGLSVWRLRVCPADLAPIQADARSTGRTGRQNERAPSGVSRDFPRPPGRCGLEAESEGCIRSSQRLQETFLRDVWRMKCADDDEGIFSSAVPFASRT